MDDLEKAAIELQKKNANAMYRSEQITNNKKALGEAEERGRRGENEACAKLSDEYDKLCGKDFVMFAQLAEKIRARMEEKGTCPKCKGRGYFLHPSVEKK